MCFVAGSQCPNAGGGEIKIERSRLVATGEASERC